MKKLSIFLMGALGMLAATSCAEKIDPAPIQSNPQEPILVEGDITSTPQGPLASTAVLNLADYSAPMAIIPVMAVAETKDLPDGAVVYYNLELCASEDFTGKVITLQGTAEDGVSTVLGEAWNAAHYALFSKNPTVEQTVYYRVPVYVEIDGTNYRYSGNNFYAVKGSLREVCINPGYNVAEHYYFLSDVTTWTLGDAGAFAFKHSEEDIYDDPVFTYTFNVPADMAEAGGVHWQILAGNADNTLYGPEMADDESMAGMLVDVNAAKGLLVDPGKYKVTINMAELTFEFEVLTQPEMYYTPGAANDWSHAASAYMQLKSDKGCYYGAFPIVSNGFKMCEEDNWDFKPGNWGAEVEAPALTGNLVSGDEGKNILAPADGFYWFMAKFDLSTYELTTYEMVEINTVGLIGSFAASGWSSDVLMTTEDAGVTWTAEAEFNAGDSFKVRFNGDWAYNYGGDFKHLTWDGPDMKVEEAGTYTVTFTVQPGYPKITLTKK